MSEREDRERADAKDFLRWSKETQRNINFIISQQAQFSADMQRLNEIHARTAGVVDRLATVTLGRFVGVEGEVGNLEAKMRALVDSHIRINNAHERLESKMGMLADSHRRLESKMGDLAEAQRQSDERLKSFINAVERLISERRGGGSEGF